MVMFWERLSSVFSLSSIHLYFPSASYSTVCFHRILILYLPFFFLKATGFCKGFFCKGDLFGAVFHVEKSTEEIIIQRSHLEKICFGLVMEVFY